MVSRIFVTAGSLLYMHYYFLSSSVGNRKPETMKKFTLVFILSVALSYSHSTVEIVQYGK